jgi:succinoglycan biosynthesis protein ExoO
VSTSSAQPTATVAIPVYNSASTLARCLRSAAAQTLRDIEILVADDGSTDASAAVAADFAQRDHRVRLLRMPCNGGKPRVMNRMTDEARGRWFAVLDADDVYRPERLARLIEAAETAGVEMAADNPLYYDSTADCAVQTAFDLDAAAWTATKADLAANSNPFGTFDFGILKPVVRRDFLLQQAIRYYEDARLCEDFYYLVDFFVAGGRGRIIAEPLYQWTQPFGAISRRWTETGSGPWRYDYRKVLRTNRHFIAKMERNGETGMVAMLQERERKYISMIHYIDAQRAAAEHRLLDAALGIILHPSTYGLLAQRVTGRGIRALTAFVRA